MSEIDETDFDDFGDFEESYEWKCEPRHYLVIWPVVWPRVWEKCGYEPCN